MMHSHYFITSCFVHYFLWRYVRTFLVRNCPVITKLSEEARRNKILDNNACSITLLSKSVPTLSVKYVARL